MKSLDDIWQEYLNNSLNNRTLKDLIWHIENDPNPGEAIVMVTDMIIEEPNNLLLKNLTFCLVNQLNHEDDHVREVTVGCVIGRLKLPEYAEKALDMAKNDPYKNVRDLSTSSLGAVINKVDFNLQKKIANYLYNTINNTAYSTLFRHAAYESILEAMNVPVNLWTPAKLHPNIQNMIDSNLLEDFKKKYHIQDVA